MEISFIDDKTVSIKASLPWSPLRPPLGSKKILRKGYFVEEFQKQHPSYKVKSASGPESICNFRSEEDSIGAWVLDVSNTKKKSTSIARTSTKKTHAKEKTTKTGA